MKLKIPLVIGIVLIFAGLSVISCQPEEEVISPDLPRYTEAQVTTIAWNYVGGYRQDCTAKTSYEGNGIWEVRFSASPYPGDYLEKKWAEAAALKPRCHDLKGKVLIFDEKTGAIH